MPLVPPSQRVGYTLEEVARHNGKDGEPLWIIINRKVYDVTQFHKRHPGGEAVLKQMGGKDATAASAASHKSALAANLMWEFCIGSVVRFKAPAPEPGLAKPLPPSLAPAVASAGPAPNRRGSTDDLAVGKALVPKPVPASPQPRRPSPGKGVAQSGKAAGVKPVGSAPPLKERQVPRVDAQAGLAGGAPGGKLALPYANGTEDCLAAAARALSEELRADPRLERWCRCSDASAMDAELHRWLSGALPWSKIPAGRLQGDSLSECTGCLVDALLDAFKRPMPLGEDVMVVAIASLGCQDATEAERARRARFAEQVHSSIVEDYTSSTRSRSEKVSPSTPPRKAAAKSKSPAPPVRGAAGNPKAKQAR